MKDFITNFEALREPAKPLKFLEENGMNDEESKSLVADLVGTLEANPNLIAITAPELGIPIRALSIRFNDVIKTFINPIVTKKSDIVIAPEIWRGLPGKEILTSRPNEITVIYYTGDLKYEENKLLGPAARLFDQQVQILDGVLPDDLGLVSDIEEDGSLVDTTEKEMAQLVEIYKEWVKVKAKALKESIEADPDLANQYREIAFSEKVIRGEAAVVDDTVEKRVKEAKTAAAFTNAKAASLAQKANFNAFINKQMKRK